MKKLPVVATLITFVAIVILLKLGFWQLQRGEEKRLIAQQLQVRGEFVYNNLSDAVNEPGAVDFRKVKLNGRVAKDRVFYWDNRIVEGKVGYEVLVPVITDAGVLITNFGWIQDTSFRQHLPMVALPEEVRQKVVTLYQLSLNRLIDNNAVQTGWPMLIAQPDLKFLAAQLELELLPYIAYLAESEQYDLRNNFKPVTMSPAKHLGYAIQWFGLAIACLLVYVFAVKKKWQHDRKSKQ